MSIHDLASSSLISTYRAFRVYTRKVGLVLTILFPGILIITLVINAFNPEILYNPIFQILWIFLVLNSLFFSVFSALHNYKFDKQIQDYTDIGLPINSTAGFKYSKNQIKNSLAISYWVTLSSVVSYAFYKLSDFYHTSDNNSEFIFSEILIFLAIGVSLISLSIFLSLDIPATYALEPGNLLSYYRPQIYPNAIDNILGDSAKLFLDPLSRYQFDDWVHDIGEKLNPAFETRRTLKNRVEIGIEKLILLMYLRLKMPKLEIGRAHV